MVTATIAAHFHISDCRQALPQHIANKPSDRYDPNHGRDRNNRVDAGIFPHHVYRTLAKNGPQLSAVGHLVVTAPMTKGADPTHRALFVY
jgi:hypothetical protein